MCAAGDASPVDTAWQNSVGGGACGYCNSTSGVATDGRRPSAISIATAPVTDIVRPIEQYPDRAASRPRPQPGSLGAQSRPQPADTPSGHVDDRFVSHRLFAVRLQESAAPQKHPRRLAAEPRKYPLGRFERRSRATSGSFKSESRVPPSTLAPRFSRAADGNTGNSMSPNFWWMLGRHDPGRLIDETPDLGFEASAGS